MAEAVRVFSYVNLVAFAGLGAIAAWQWRKTRGNAGAWAALAFASLGVVVLVSQFLPTKPRTDAQLVLSRLIIGLLVLFPFFLYRFTTAFRAPSRGLRRYVSAMTVVLLVATATLPKFPAAGEHRPAWFIAYLIVFVVHWAILSVAVTVRLWRAGRAQPGVARRRMQLFSFASAAMTVAIFFAAAGARKDSPVSLATSIIAFLSAIAFMLALHPPALLRLLWRRREQQSLNDAIGRLMTASTEEEVAEHVLPPVARMVAASTIELQDEAGERIGVYSEPGVTSEFAMADLRRLTTAFRGGRLVVSASSYAPFFGSEELRLLNILGSMAGLALDRTRLFAAERTARAELERANELQANFVSLAAHELRAPFAVVHGIVETLRNHRDSLDAARTETLEETLYRQTDRLRLLVNQLLDLSRLEASAIPIQAQTIDVKQRIEDVVVGAAGPGDERVAIQIDPSLRATADPNVLDRVVSNLVTNALRYGAPPIVVTAEQRDRHFRVAVEDRGPGVPDAFVPTLFDRFTRSEEGRGHSEGSGLGLAIARAYAQAHGGDLIYSQGRPHGAHFEFVLPTPAVV